MKLASVVIGMAVATALVSCAKSSIPVELSQNRAAIKARFGSEDLHWIIQREVSGNEVTCGYVGLSGRPFIARSGRVFLEEDLPAGQFDRWEKGLCGPDWVEPLQMPPAPS